MYIYQFRYGPPKVKIEAAKRLSWLGPVAKDAMPYLIEVLHNKNENLIND
jgi:hypothetical protein